VVRARSRIGADLRVVPVATITICDRPPMRSHGRSQRRRLSSQLRTAVRGIVSASDCSDLHVQSTSIPYFVYGKSRMDRPIAVRRTGGAVWWWCIPRSAWQSVAGGERVGHPDPATTNSSGPALPLGQCRGLSSANDLTTGRHAMLKSGGGHWRVAAAEFEVPFQLDNAFDNLTPRSHQALRLAASTYIRQRCGQQLAADQSGPATNDKSSRDF